MKDKEIETLYLITDHTSFYERYGWEFFCEVQGDGEDYMSRICDWIDKPEFANTIIAKEGFWQQEIF